MSKPEAAEGPAEFQALSRLEDAVVEAADRIARLRKRARAAEKKARELQEMLRKFAAGEEDPASTIARLRAMEEENRELRTRLADGVAGVDRLLARIRFLEEHG